MVAHKVPAPAVVGCSPRNRLLGDSVASAKLLRSCQHVLFHGLSTKRRAITECTQEAAAPEKCRGQKSPAHVPHPATSASCFSSSPRCLSRASSQGCSALASAPGGDDRSPEA